MRVQNSFVSPKCRIVHAHYSHDFFDFLLFLGHNVGHKRDQTVDKEKRKVIRRDGCKYRLLLYVWLFGHVLNLNVWY